MKTRRCDHGIPAILLLPIILFLFCQGPVLNPENISSEVKAVLVAQKEAWNNGDVERFMDGYIPSEDLTFQSKNSRIRGWQVLMDRYKTNYAGEKMGVLNFTDIEVTPLSDRSAYVIGRFRVDTKDSSSEGLFTLIFRLTDDGWKIIHDHTSS